MLILMPRQLDPFGRKLSISAKAWPLVSLTAILQNCRPVQAMMLRVMLSASCSSPSRFRLRTAMARRAGRDVRDHDSLVVRGPNVPSPQLSASSASPSSCSWVNRASGIDTPSAHSPPASDETSR